MTFLRRLTVITYSQQFISECIVIYPLYALMFSQRSGLTTTEISLLLAWWLFVILASELPTGVLADRFSKKYVLFFSNTLKAAAFGIWLIMPNFTGYALGFLVWGVGCALNSGAFQAYLYETLQTHQSTRRFTKLYSRSQALALIGMVVGYIAASLIGTAYPLLLGISIAVSVASAGLVLFFPSQLHHVQNNISHISLLKGGLSEVKASPAIKRIVITLTFVAGIGQVGQQFTPLYYSAVGILTSYIAPLLALGLGLSALLAWIAHRFERTNNLFQLVILAIGGLILFVTSFQGMIMAMLGMLVFVRLTRLSSLLYESILQHNISERYRATIGSIPMFLSEALSILIIVAYGSVAHLFGDRASVQMLGLLTIASASALLIYWQKRTIPNRYPQAKIALPLEEQPGS